MLALVPGVHAASYDVCASACDFASIDAALVSGTLVGDDELLLAAETYVVDSEAIDIDLTLTGVGPSTIVSASTTTGLVASSGAHLVLQDLSLVPGSDHAVEVVDAATRLVLRRVSASAVSGAGDGLVATAGAGTELVVEDCDFSDIESTGGSGAVIATDDAIVQIVDTRFIRSTAAGGAGAVWLRGGSADVVRSTFCGGGSGAQAGGLWLDGVSTGTGVWASGFASLSAVDGGALVISGDGAFVANNTFAATSASGDGGALAAYSDTIDVVNNLFYGVSGASALYLEGAAATGWTLSNNALFANAAGDLASSPAAVLDGSHLVGVDPQVLDPVVDCDADDWFLPGLSSPLVGAGVGTDTDGSTADIGATGGLDADPGWHLDGDSDGVVEYLDCDDGDGARYPGATEVCDSGDVDEDCDGQADDADPDIDYGMAGASTFFVDADGDGWGSTATVLACDDSGTTSTNDQDCDDTASGVRPDGTEVCDTLLVDEDCDSLINDADPSVVGTSTFYADADADGHGDAGSPVQLCAIVAGYATTDDDCDDSDELRSPSVAEVCDPADVDEDCDGLSDNDDPDAVGNVLWYDDGDADGFGDDQDPGVQTCDPPTGTVADNTDCDDSDAASYPGADEVWYDGADQACDGGDDYDQDGDGHQRLDPGDDCDDLDAGINPSVPEVLDDGIDQDCTGFDRTTRVVGGKWGCSTAPTAPPWLALPLLLLLRRRR